MHIYGCSIKGECPHMASLEIDGYPTQVCLNGNTWCDRKLGEIKLSRGIEITSLSTVEVVAVVSMEVGKLSERAQVRKNLKEIVKELLSEDRRLIVQIKE